MDNMLCYNAHHQTVNINKAMRKRHTFSLASHSHNKTKQNTHETSTKNVTARTKYANANVFLIVPEQ